MLTKALNVLKSDNPLQRIILFVQVLNTHRDIYKLVNL